MCDDYKYPFMKSLIDRIIQDGHSLDGGILKVDRFINHQMDPYLKIKKMNVYEEAARCLLCQDAPCTKACQTGDPARAIRAIRFDNLKPALRWVENCSDADLERAEQACIPTKVVVASIMGQTEEEWIQLAKMAEEAGCDAVELNFSCPQMKHEGMGSDVGQSPTSAA